MPDKPPSLPLASLFLCTLAAAFLLLPSAATAQPPTCDRGTVADYIGTSCSQLQAVFHWTSYTCTSTPARICDSLGRNGSKLHMLLDPNGPRTLLVGNTSLWNVKAGESVGVVIRGTIYGAVSNGNWPHFQGQRGQTGDGTENNITTVDCGANCRSLNGVSEVPCSATSPPANCEDTRTVGPYLRAIAEFPPATSANPYPMTVEVKLDGGTSGTATLYSVGIHVSDMPPRVRVH
jgi:hypothetical protein